MLSGCSGGGDSTTPPTNTATYADFHIKSAVYNNNATSSVLDDKLYIYFSKSIDSNSIAIDTSANYTLNGTGEIGTASSSSYSDTNFHRHTIGLNNNGSTSIALVPNDTKISLAQDTITDSDGNYPNDYNITKLEKFNAFSNTNTGQTDCYDDRNASATIDCSDPHALKDDGYYQSGKTRSFTHNGNNTVTDNATGLMWQDNTDAKDLTKAWADAINYCETLSLGGHSDWRLPSIEELVSITDKGRVNPSIDPSFANVASSNYWSSTTNVSNSDNAWNVNFNNGNDNNNNKTGSNYVRCVRSADNGKNNV